MTIGYDSRLYVLAFDHRGSFQSQLYGIAGAPNAEDTARMVDGKRLIFEGLAEALDRGADPATVGVLVDEQFGGTVPGEAKARGMTLAMPVERSGVDVFDFAYGEDFGEHITRSGPDFAKVLVRYNPDGDADANATQLERLRRLSDWLLEHEPKLLFELLVPAEPAQLAAVDGDGARFDRELRPDLVVRTIEHVLDARIEVDLWKIEGLEERSDCERVVDAVRAGGRDHVSCILLGRGADDAQVDHWLTQAAPVDGFTGFAIGRSIWSAPLEGFLAGALSREEAVRRVADNYLRFVSVYEAAE